MTTYNVSNSDWKRCTTLKPRPHDIPQRGISMKTALTLTLLLVVPAQILAQAERSGSLPQVDGYRLGADWQTIGRLMPCRSGPNGFSEMEKVYAGAFYTELTIDHLRFCEASDSVNLHFYQDTLFRINVVFPPTNRTPTALWNQTRDWAVRTFGEPDSVVAYSMGDSDFVAALWTNPTRQWKALVVLTSGLADQAGTVHLAHCKFLPAVCEVLFAPRPWR